MTNALGASGASITEVNDSGTLPERHVPEEVIENEVEAPREETDQEEKPEKTFTQKELDDILKRRLDKQDRRAGKQLAELNARIEELSKAQKALPTPDSGKKDEAPKRADFDLYEDYLEAKAAHTASKGIAEEIAKLRAEREEEKATSKKSDSEAAFQKQAETRIQEGRKEYPDFDSVINDAFEDGVLELDSELYYGLIDSDMGHRLAYYLSLPKNHAEAERIAALSPRGVQRELGKLEVKLAGKEKTKPDTMEVLNGSRSIKQSDAMRADLSMDEFVRLRNAAERKRRGF